MKREKKRPYKNLLRIRRWMAVFGIFVLVLQLGSIQASAASIESGKGNLSVSADASYLYFNYEGEWSNYLSDQIQVSADGSGSLGALSAITLNQSNDGESGSLTVRNAWNGTIKGAGGSVTNSGKKEHYGYESMKWSIQLPISAYAEYSFQNMTFSWGGKSVTLSVQSGVTEATTEAATEKPTEVTTEENGGETTTEMPTEESSSEVSTEITTENSSEAATEATTEEAATEEDIIVSGGIQIDGMYDDWKDIPKTEITYDSNNEDCVHYGQMFTDGKNIYAHFQTNQLYTSQMQIQLWYLTINGQQFALQIWPEKNGSIDWGTQIPSSEGTHTNLKVFIGYGSDNECNSQVVYTIYDETHAADTPGDDIEFSFSLERLSELTGIPVDQMGTISLSNPNLGGASVTIAGSSTGPVAGVLVAFLLAAAFYKKKKGMRKL